MPSQATRTALRGRAPYRVSLAGGGTDLPFFADEHGGAVLTTNVAMYVHATLLPRRDHKVRVFSLDYDIVAAYDLAEPLMNQQTQLKLFDAVMRRFAPEDGFDLFIESDVPVGSGLGASGAIAALTTALLANYTRRPMTRYEIAELAFEANRELQGERVGRQDEYAATFGGVNFIEFRRDAVTVVPLRLRSALTCEIEHRFLLCHAPVERTPEDPVNEQVRLYREGRRETMDAMVALRDVAYAMRDHLCREDLNAVAADLRQAGNLKALINPAAAAAEIDAMLEAAFAAGGIGGKLLGAGGGGHLLVVCGDGRKGGVAEALTQCGGQVVPFLMDSQGIATWVAEIEESPVTHPFYRNGAS